MSSSTPRRRTGRLFAAATAAALGLGASLFLAGPAQAADTVKAQLSLTGVATEDNPTGGSVVGIHPGDSVTISPATVPTAGLKKLGLDDLLGGVTGLLASYQVEADFSGLPGGAKATTLDSNGAVKSKTFTFPKAGTYKFTWSAQSLGLLGAVPINLDGNQLKKAGVELNAKNQYVGEIVVATNPPKGGISVQLPGTSVQPKVGPIQLPKVNLPGITTPTIPTSLPGLNIGGSTGGSSGGSSSGGSSSSGSTGNGLGVLPVPAMVVPQGTGQVIGSSGSYDYQSTSTGGSFSASGSGFGTPASSSSGSTKAASAQAAAPAAKTTTVAEPAGSRPAATSGMPVVLAVVAVIALVLVAGTYARLFLIGNSGKGTSPKA